MDFFAVAFFFACSATTFDLLFKTIPDWLNAAFFLLALSAAFAYNAVLPLALYFTLAFVFSKTLYSLGAWGGGDAKFFIVLCCFLAVLGEGVESAVLLFVVSSFLLGVFFLALATSLLKNVRVNYLREGRMVFAPFLAIAFAIVVFFA